MKEKEIWDYLINKANEVKSKRIISPFIEEGQVAAAILTKNGNVFTGVCIDTSSTLGICAERNAIHTMITNNESQIDRIVCIDINDNLYTPCGACRELIMQLGKNSKNIKILIDKYKYITMKELMPNWWGNNKY